MRNWALRDEKNAQEERDRGIREQLMLREGLPSNRGTGSDQDFNSARHLGGHGLHPETHRPAFVHREAGPGPREGLGWICE